ncbi:MAG: hypothetical protein E6K80_00725 [Candidatus Eisenbacteria bacterium]|uniref:Uncharacterized protein n=1 Tax=Eiseniibacteriota bacterium TaxID=2212470 RepID=A0A538UBF5_UNCEI|nr:MAG: hypothetical protein E6K80_00725 [Candidatus Eisenbacteria bacterium]
MTAESDRGPLPDPDSHAGEWGDYLTVRRCHPQEDRFIASGYTMQGAGDGSNRDCTPRFVVFGRSPACCWAFATPPTPITSWRSRP